MERITLHIDQLVINPDINPRHASDDDVSDLVAQIHANGFTDAIWVRPVSEGFAARARLLASKAPAGEPIFEVIDGSRRLRALRVLMDGDKNLSTWRNFVDCDLIEADDAKARELALAANVARAPLSAADEARAFYALKVNGMAHEQIAEHFAVPVERVRQRIAIGQLPDQIIDALRSGRIGLETARAFTLTNSRELQLKIFDSAANLSAWTVRDAITKKTVAASDYRAKFLGLDAYREAGGQVLEDLFSTSAYLNNERLLQKLFDEKFKATVKDFKDAGWSFVTVLSGNDIYRQTIKTVPAKGKRELRPADVERLAGLESRLATINETLDRYEKLPRDADEPDDEEALRVEAERIESQITQINARPYTPKQKEALGVIIAVPRHSEIEIKLGCLPIEKEKKAKAQAKIRKDAASDSEQDEPREPARVADFSEAVELALVTAGRAAIKLAMIKDKPAIAARIGLAARVQAWLADVIDGYYDEPPFAITKSDRLNLDGGPIFAAHLASLSECFTKHRTMATVLAALETMTPEQITELEATMAAHWLAVSSLVNADVMTIIDAIDPDMRAEGFSIDAEFMAKLSRDQIALITAEINPDAPVAKGKKPEMIAAALPLIINSGWLPAQLRTPSYNGPGSSLWKPQPAAEPAQAEARQGEAA